MDAMKSDQDAFDKRFGKEPSMLGDAHRKRMESESTKPSPEEMKAVAAARRRMVEDANLRAAQKRKRLQDLFSKYDTDSTGYLDESQLRNLLTAMDNSSPPGTEPSDEELNLVLKVAVHSHENALIFDELESALKVWDTYTRNKDFMMMNLQKFDKSGTGKLDFQELKAYLVSLNGGGKVMDEEVQWVMSEADIFGDGAISLQEMVMATSAWYVHPRPRRTYTGDETSTHSGSCCIVS